MTVKALVGGLKERGFMVYGEVFALRGSIRVVYRTDGVDTEFYVDDRNEDSDYYIGFSTRVGDEVWSVEDMLQAADEFI
jgi:hypothetical protein